jgi:hypothetical protein
MGVGAAIGRPLLEMNYFLAVFLATDNKSYVSLDG